jgi:predicted nucleic-acid-binding Zn-ribbon protein
MHHGQSRQSKDPQGDRSQTGDIPNVCSDSRNTEVWSVPQPAEVSELTHDQLSEHLRFAQVNRAHYAAVVNALKTELAKRSPTSDYQCMKCGHQRYQLNQIRTPRTWLSAFFGVETAQYQAVVCSRCKFTEFYQGSVPLGQQVLDAVFGQ